MSKTNFADLEGDPRPWKTKQTWTQNPPGNSLYRLHARVCSCSVIVRPDGPGRFLVPGARAATPGAMKQEGSARRRGADKAKPPPGGGEQEPPPPPAPQDVEMKEEAATGRRQDGDGSD
ncbi:hypothetical protein P7K49_011593 [Saguinus oedipus]|uniref:Uncharacterized protein n=1 Tax=Saguinus oedipus TaxID=9490 RepID=A0ABQ9VUQ2_SAGOE|nr:hypothetical protein P7K49_011593 [Saguinus oedipus]